MCFIIISKLSMDKPPKKIFFNIYQICSIWICFFCYDKISDRVMVFAVSLIS